MNYILISLHLLLESIGVVAMVETNREIRHAQIRILTKECELKTLAALYQKIRQKVGETNTKSGNKPIYSHALSLWSDDQFRKCLVNGHTLYNELLAIASVVLVEHSPNLSVRERALALNPAMAEAAGRLGAAVLAKQYESSNRNAAYSAENALAWEKYSARLADLLTEACPGSNIPLSSIYVESRVRYTDSINRDHRLVSWLSQKLQRNEETRAESISIVDVAKDSFEAISDWVLSAASSDDALSILRGGPGSGKSTFAKAVASGYAFAISGMTKSKLRLNQILFIQLQKVPKGVDTTADIIGWYLNDRNLFPHGRPDLSSFASGEKLLLIFDGLDELSQETAASIEASERFLQDLRGWLNSQNKLEVTTLALVIGRTVLLQGLAQSTGALPPSATPSGGTCHPTRGRFKLSHGKGADVSGTLF